ncbi:MAG: peptidase S10 [Alphaproteobacteria bacterium]|nr:peptidase S10 [Alphaproteobacteria bacterium]MCB9696414.1 peptidase S10 [Alphaproteobacteria bacterium]
MSDKNPLVVATAEDLKQALQPSVKEPPAEKVSTTRHEVVIDGVTVAYTATAGTLPVRLEDKKKPAGKLFYVSYVREGVESTQRPVAFCFNGGPGSSSVWLHMGCLGPMRVVADVDHRAAPSMVAVDNPYSLLDRCDLVFVDPMSTGHSRPDEGEGEDYHGVTPDLESVGDFIRRWTTRNNRWASPKLVVGESYGTTRAAALARHLQDRYGMFVDGLVLISLALQFQTLIFENNDLAYVLYVPAYTATAAYHGRVETDDVDALVADATRWAFDHYMPALLRGSALPVADRRAVAAQLAAYLGVDVDYVLRCDLRVDLGRFCRELLRDRRLAVGRLDSRFTGAVADAQQDRLEADPSLSGLMGQYTSALHHHLRSRLAWDEEDVYEILNLKANQAWKFREYNEYLDVTGDLRTAMLDNPHLDVLVASGTYDLATPVTASDYTIAHLGAGLEQRVVHHKYPAGHMMYAHEPSLARLRVDLCRFLGRTGDRRAS